jgi:hypothetical protein
MSEQTIATRLEELERAAAENDKRPLVSRSLGEPWGAGWPDSTPVELTLGALREIVGRLADLQETPEFIAMLRAKGVTRYRRGDLEIELGAARQIDARQIDERLPPPTDAQRALDDSLDHQLERRFGGAPEPKRCGACHEPEPGHKEGCWVAEAKRDEAPADDQPAVEIDMAAVEEKIREQDAKRRGTPSQ